MTQTIKRCTYLYYDNFFYRLYIRKNLENYVNKKGGIYRWTAFISQRVVTKEKHNFLLFLKLKVIFKW